MLIIAGSLRIIGDYYMFNELGFTAQESEKNNLTPHELTPYFYGSVVGISLIGPIYDFFFAGAPHLVLMFFALANILCEIFLLITHG